jgi:hypothetical protein
MVLDLIPVPGTGVPSSDKSSVFVSSWRDREVRRREVLAPGPNEGSGCTLIREVLPFFGGSSPSTESSSPEDSLEADDLGREVGLMKGIEVEIITGGADLG